MMTTKSEYLSALQDKAYIQSVGTPVETGESNDYLTIYEVEVVETDGSSAAVKGVHRFAVSDEGGAGESAYAYGPAIKPYYRTNDPVYAAVKSYIDAIAAVKAFRIVDFDTAEQWAKVFAWVFVTDHIEEKYYLVWNAGGLTHQEIV